MYAFLPAVFALSIVLLVQGMPMTFQSDYEVMTLEPAAMGVAGWFCDHVRPLPADSGADRDGRLSWDEEKYAIRPRYVA